MNRNALGLIVSLMLAPQLSLAAPILTQTPAINAVILSDFNGTQIAADDFALATGDFVRTVGWQGMYLLGETIPVADAFTFNFYAADNLGEVGALLRTFTVGNNVNRAGTGVIVSVGGGRHEILSYFADLGEDLALGTGKFWLSIANNTAADADVNWQWAGNLPFFGPFTYEAAFSVDNGQTFTGGNFTTYLTLDGGNAGLIPEPETYAMMLAGLGLLGWAGRRRKPQGA